MGRLWDARQVHEECEGGARGRAGAMADGKDREGAGEGSADGEAGEGGALCC